MYSESIDIAQHYQLKDEWLYFTFAVSAYDFGMGAAHVAVLCQKLCLLSNAVDPGQVGLYVKWVKLH